MTPHPDRNALSRRLARLVGDIESGFRGELFRFHNPEFATTADLFAGKGSLWTSGRWLLKSSVRCTYTSLSPETALGESLAAARYYRLPVAQATPAVVVSATAKLTHVIDLREGAVRQRLRIAARTILETDWRRENRQGREAITQAWGDTFQRQGLEGFLVPSAARPGGTNLVVFPSNLRPGNTVKVAHEVNWPRD